MKHLERPDGSCPRCGSVSAVSRVKTGGLTIAHGVCEICGDVGPCREVLFRQNIGAIVVRFKKEVRGHLCHSCVDRHFTALTATTLFVGWWGLVSFFITPYLLVTNVIEYARARWS